MIANTAQIRPLSDESFERYTIRAHRALSPAISDPFRRNELIRRYWRRFRGMTEAEQAARECFQLDRYELVPDVCVFAEHATKDEEGQTRRFDLKELARIVRNCNERIADVNAFPAIADGHTTDDSEGDAAARDPAVLGYAGPFRLGQIGRKKPLWAIFQDEYRLKSAQQVLASKPRRSVELWTYKDSGRSHFDPIAALGAEAPRLPLPVRFSTHHHHGATVERYSAAAAPCYPSGSNTFVKKPIGGGRRKPTKYQEKPAMLSPEDKAELIDALGSLPQMQFLDQLMQSPQAQALLAPTLDPADQAASDEMANEDAADDLDVPADDAAPDAVPDSDDDLADLADLLDKDETEENPKKFAQHYQARGKKSAIAARKSNANGNAGGNGHVNGSIVVARYQALANSHKKLLRDHGQLQTQVQAIRRESVDANRRNRLQELANEYPHFIDVEEEFQNTLYSMGANVPDEEFDKHVARLERYAQRSSPVTRMIPQGEVTTKRVRNEQYEQRKSEMAVKLCTDAVDRGEVLNYAEASAKAEQLLDGK